MKTLTISVIGILLLSAVSPGDDFEIHSGYIGGLTLVEYDTLWMTGGGAGLITLDEHSEAIIEGTLPLEEFVGGIWELNTGGYSSLNFSGGDLRELVTHSYATATLSGGRIDYLRSSQGVGYPYIDLYCRTWDYNSTTKMLTGIWNTDNDEDGLWDAFNIQLIDIQGYIPTFKNINFIVIPEPATLTLVGLGGLLLRHKRT